MDVDKNYETVFILDPSLTQKDAEQTFKNIKDFITDNEGIIIEATNIGIIKLAYPIGGKHLGNYFLEFHITITVEKIKEKLLTIKKF